MEDSRKADPRLTEGEWDELVEHLNDSGRERHQARMREQNKQIPVELAGLRFKPKINKKSREMAAHNNKLPDRLEHVLHIRQEKINREKSRQAQEVIAQVTAKPVINKRSKKIMRSENDLLAYGEDRTLRAQYRRQYYQDIQDRELTFRPQLSSRSMAICKQMTKDGKDVANYRSKYKQPIYSGTNQDPGHEEETFHPKINQRSKEMSKQRYLKGTKGVHSRLYKSAVDETEKKQTREKEHISAHVNMNKVELNRPAHMGISATTMAIRQQGVSLLASSTNAAGAGSGGGSGMMMPPGMQGPPRVSSGAPPTGAGAGGSSSGTVSGTVGGTISMDDGEVKITATTELAPHERGPLQNQTAMGGVNTVSYNPKYAFILKHLGVTSR